MKLMMALALGTVISAMVSVSAWAQIFRCQVEDSAHKTLLEAFDLSVIQQQGEAVISLPNDRTGTQFIGKLQSADKNHKPDHWLRFKEFENLLPDYETTLLVPEQIYQLKNAKAHIVGHGDSLYTEDYNCERQDETH